MNEARFIMVLKESEAYTTEYAERLAGAIRRNTPSGTEVICLTDAIGLDMDTVPLKHGLPGWWSKMEMFGNKMLADGRLNIYLDLDTLICGDLTALTEYTGDLACLADLYKPDRQIGSGIVLWRGRVMSQAWETFIAAPERIMHEHQIRMDYFLARWLNEGDRIQELWPGMAVSYKRHCRKNGGPPEGARIICFHGKPRPRDLDEADWAGRMWRGNGIKSEKRKRGRDE
jgi:hypothetical protein